MKSLWGVLGWGCLIVVGLAVLLVVVIVACVLFGPLLLLLSAIGFPILAFIGGCVLPALFKGDKK